MPETPFDSKGNYYINVRKRARSCIGRITHRYLPYVSVNIHEKRQCNVVMNYDSSACELFHYDDGKIHIVQIGIPS